MIRNAMRVAALCAAALSATAFAQSYPARPIRVVVPFPAGGTADILARVVGQKMSETWGQQVVVDNRAGAGGNIAAEIAAKSKPDGYTLFLCTVGTHAIHQTLYRKLPFDPLKDFAGIAYIAGVPNVLVVHPSIPARNVKELVAFIRSRPGQVNFGSSGTGSSVHMSGEMLKSMAGLNMTHIAYKGNPQAVTDLMAGQIELMVTNMPSVIPYIESHRLRALAVTTRTRSPALPDVPTMEEAGMTGYESSAWFGLVGQAAMPRDIVHKLNAETVRILKLSDVKQNLASQGADPLYMSAEEFDAFMQAETAKWSKVVKAAGVYAD
ncbi:MAG TPA: tripartite tricarboxylate transporter substrate binding protein [Burkholderiales bacterium]|nr:tripartite tricarboxylate transporter substrate binding protein [Burkholderiales bacterium]